MRLTSSSKAFSKQAKAQGKALGVVFLIVGALLISALVFFFVTKPQMDAKQAAAEQTLKNEPELVSPAPAAPAPTKPVEVPVKAEPAKPQFGFARPADVGARLMQSLSEGNSDDAAKLIAVDRPEIEALTKDVLEALKAKGLKIGPASELMVIGQSGNATRLSLPLLNADNSPSTERILVDVVRDPKMGFKVESFKLPASMEASVAEATQKATPELAANMQKTLSVEKSPDALTFASDFVQALLKPDHDAARAVIDDQKLSAVKLAALCMVFEEGQYELQTNRPLLATVSTDTTSWIIAKVQSRVRNEQTEFGVEMEKQGEAWKVIALNLSQLLSDSTQPATSLGLPYTPLVKNPKGGESIAMYFEYDSAILGERARKQLEIVGEILKSSPTKKLKISGHTDDLGSDAYNAKLSRDRAAAVKQFFETYGVPTDQVETVGLGKEMPLSPNQKSDGSDNPEGRSRNRRAEILLDF